MAMSTSSSEEAELTNRVAGMPPEHRRRLLAALIRAYSQGPADEPPVDADELTADDVAVMAAALMRAKEVTSFELAALFNV